MKKHLSKKRSSWTGRFTAVALSAALLLPAFQAPVGAASPVGALPAGQALTKESAETFLDAFFQSEAAAPHYVGAAVVVVKDGEVLASKGYGYADKASETPVDPSSTVFRIASVSKSFNAVAAMQLVEQGKIGLDQDIRGYLKDLKIQNPFDKPVTVGDLLAHTTGFRIQDPLPEDIHGDLDKVVSIDEYVREHLPPVVREPGTSYMYDNFASMLLGLIVENVGGQPYEQYMDEHLFQPLGMENSGFLLGGELLEQLATLYDAANEPMDVMALTPTVMPQGGMLSTADDVGKFMVSFLAGGAVDNGNRILKEETVESMTEYRSLVHALLPDTTYGFEAPFQLPGAGSSPSIITKGGDLPGNSSYLFMIPEQNTGVFLTYNKTGALRNLFYPQFIGTFFPQYAAPADLEPFQPQSGEELERFAGYYSDLRLNMLVSSLGSADNNGLAISDAFLGERRLTQVDENLFLDTLGYQFTGFKTDENGNVLYMKEPYINSYGYAKKGGEAAGFKDLDGDDPYAYAITALQSLGYYNNDPDESFLGEKPVTRAEFLKNIAVTSNLKGSKSTEYAFADIQHHPAAAYIQQAYELGMIVGNGSGEFRPDRNITRQEAAVILWRSYSALYPSEWFADVQLDGEFDQWAASAVQMMVAFGYHGPEVLVDENGAADYLAKQVLNRQQEAALLYSLLTQPANQIAAALAAKPASPDAA